MHNRLGTCVLVAVSAAVAQQASAQLLIPDSTNDSIGLYSDVDGSVIDKNFIVDANDPATYDFSTPQEAIQVGNEIFVSDQNADAIFIFDLAGNYVDKIDSGLDNVRGLAYEASVDTVYVANGGGNNGAPDDQIVTIDPSTRGITGSFAFGPPDFSPWDVEVYDGQLLVTDIDGGTLNSEGVDVFNFDGSYVGRIVAVNTSNADNGPDFPQQVAGKLGDDGFLVGGFSVPSGVYEFDADGDPVATYQAGFGPRGVAELLNGDYLYTNGDGAYTFDPLTDTRTFVAGSDGSGRLISRVVIPEPATAGLLALAGLAGLRRRR
jgi:hypothetical protein